MGNDLLTDINVHQYQMLLELGAIITSKVDLDSLLPVVADQINRVLDTERCSVFLYDEKRLELWSLMATDLRKGEIRIPSSDGVIGWVFQNQKTLTINNAYNDPRFYSKVDEKTGFVTRNILCIPLINRNKTCIGTLQVLNKKSGDFRSDDIGLLNSASHFIAIALENAMLYEQMDLMLKARERAINHLSHELITPLSIISGVLETIRRKIGAECLKELDSTLNRGLRNVNRLLKLQRKIDDIFNHRQLDDQQRMLRIIKTAVDLVEGLGEEVGGSQQKSLELISLRLSDLFQLKEPRTETIFLPTFLNGICDRIALKLGKRNIRIERKIGRPIHLITDSNMLSMVCEGLLQNAVENTPDEGRICVSTYREEGLISVQVHDYGVGITPKNQKNIFVGFFHTQETDLYSSKEPYAFNAGGAGVDLLRIRSFAERFGFDIDFESRRCCYLPTDGDVCPGRISECHFVESPIDCQRSGFSTFKLTWRVKVYETSSNIQIAPIEVRSIKDETKG